MNRPVNSALPRQQVSLKEKFDIDKDRFGITKWMKDTMDSLEGIGRYIFYNNVDLRKNYEIMQGRFNLEDYVDSFDAYDISSIVYEQMKLPSFMKHYDITTKAVKLLLGEYIKRPDIHQVMAEDIDSSNEKLRLKTDLTHTFIQQELTQEINKKLLAMGIDPEKNNFKNQEDQDQYKQMIEQKYQELTPDAINKYLTYDYRTAAESWGQSILLNVKKRFRLNEQDQKEFYDMLVADRCFSHIYLTNDGYNVETWNTLNTFYQYSPELNYIEDGNYVGRILYLSKPQIIDIFGWRMTLEQIESLYPEYQKDQKDGSVYSEFFNATLYPFADAREYDTLTEAQGQALGYNAMDGSPYGFPIFGFYPSTDGTNYLFTQADLVQVTQCYWKSQRKVGKLNIVNPETGESKVMLVDETFDPKLFEVKEVKEIYRDSDEPNTICWTWQTQVWQGIKVNVNYQKAQTSEDRSAIYIDVMPAPFQFKGNNPALQFKCKLPVIGQIFNNRNGRSQSLVDLLKPYQILVNAFYNQSYQIAQKNNGKFFLMGASLLPSIKDLGGEDSMEKFMTMASNIGLAVVDDAPNGTQNQNSLQYSMKVMDMDESERIVRTINLAMLIEQQGFLQIGITPQRQGTIQASETATATNTAVNNSYAITEIYFEQFSNYRRRKLEAILDIAQFCALRELDLSDSYIMTDVGDAFIKVTAGDLLLRDLAVYVNNTGEMQRKKQVVEELILKNNQNLLPLSSLIDIVRNDNLADIQKSIEKAEQEQQKNQQAQQQQEQQMQQQQLQAQAQEAEKQRQFDAEQKQLDRENKIQVATISSIGFDADVKDSPDNKIDVLDAEKLALEQSKHLADISLKTKELSHKMQESQRSHELEKAKIGQKDKELSLKRKDLEAKKALETKKIGVEREKMASDQKIERLKIKAKPKPTKK